MCVRRRFWVLLGGVLLVVLSLPLLSFPAPHQEPLPLQVLVSREPADAPDNAISLTSPPTLWVQVVDADGRLVDNADLQTVANMPTMAHGLLRFAPERVGRGLYRLRLLFSMPGSWQVQLDAQAPDYQKVSQQLTFWVQALQGASPMSPVIGEITS